MSLANDRTYSVDDLLAGVGPVAAYPRLSPRISDMVRARHESKLTAAQRGRVEQPLHPDSWEFSSDYIDWKETVEMQYAREHRRPFRQRMREGYVDMLENDLGFFIAVEFVGLAAASPVLGPLSYVKRIGALEGRVGSAVRPAAALTLGSAAAGAAVHGVSGAILGYAVGAAIATSNFFARVDPITSDAFRREVAPVLAATERVILSDAYTRARAVSRSILD